MKFPATDIEFAMQTEIDQLKARIAELETEFNEVGVDRQKTRINELEKRIAELEAELAEQVKCFDEYFALAENQIGEREARIAKLEKKRRD